MPWSDGGGERSAVRRWVREEVGGNMRLVALRDCLALLRFAFYWSVFVFFLGCFGLYLYWLSREAVSRCVGLCSTTLYLY